MIELFENESKTFDRHSSKGNQLKWERDGMWYKADYTGYEGLAEFVVSKLLEHSTLNKDEYVTYEIEEISYRHKVLLGSRSKNFLTEDWQIITLERLFRNQFDRSLSDALWQIEIPEERLSFLCDQVIEITGISNFRVYMSKLLTIDAIVKNEDRHTHNIAVLMNTKGQYKLCPIFDNGASLLANTTLDYPLGANIYDLMDEVRSKTISVDFDEQLEASEKLCGNKIKFHITHKDVEEIIESASPYSGEIKNRVKDMLFYQMRKYPYLFC